MISRPEIQPAQTIDGVLLQLDQIIEWSKNEGSRLGYFAALYRRVTAQVKHGILAGEFDDNPRMEKLDCVFANRYLVALRDYWAGKPISMSWKVAFDACNTWQPIVLQHLMAGMNAHIQLDLGIAAAQVAPGQDILGLENDFKKINQLLLGLIDQVQTDLSQVWPVMKLVDLVAGKMDEKIAGFGIMITRQMAWQVALDMANKNSEDLPTAIHTLDQRVSRIGKIIIHPGIFLQLTLGGIRIMETGSIMRKITALEK